jgi:protein-disulfide isomerase
MSMQHMDQSPDERYKVSADGFPAIGSDTAAITIVEFADFQCPFCGRFYMDTESDLLEKYGSKIRFVYRHFPMDRMHPYARQAAKAAQCAHAQGQFWAYHHLLFQHQKELANEDLLGYARELNLNMTQFQNCVDSAQTEQAINVDIQAGLDLHIDGTPTFFINGLRLDGAQPLRAFSEIIDVELASLATSQSAAR